jgi:hypothetical protein
MARVRLVTLSVMLGLFTVGCGRANYDPLLDCNGSIVDGLVGLWAFDDGAGTTAGDSSGNGHIGSLLGTPTWVEGRVAGALQFSAPDDRVGVGTAPELGLQFPMTLTAWVKPDRLTSDARHSIVGRDDADPGARQFEWGVSRNRDAAVTLYPDCVTDPQHWSGARATLGIDGSWTHVAVTFDEAFEVAHYVDGVLVLTAPLTSATICSASATTYIGGTPKGPYPWEGALDEVRLYERALTPCEITQVYCVGTWHCANGTQDCAESAVDVGADCR